MHKQIWGAHSHRGRCDGSHRPNQYHLRFALAFPLIWILGALCLLDSAYAQSEAAANMKQAAARICVAQTIPPGTFVPPPPPICAVSAASDASFLSMAPIQFAVFNTLAIQGDQQLRALIRDRIDTLQDNRSGGIALRPPQQRWITSSTAAKSYKTGGAASADQDAGGRLGTFFTIEGSKSDQDATSRQDGFDGRGYSVVGGMDYRFTPSFVLGGALGYQKNKSDFNFDRGSIDMDSYVVSAFLNWYAQQGWYVDALVSHSFNRYDNTRRFVDPLNTPQVTTSDPNGRRSSALATLGYSIYRGPFTFAPFVSVNYIHQRINAYTESGAGLLNLDVATQSQNSLTSGVGLQGNRAFSTSWGVLSLGARAEWKHEFRNDSTALPMSFSIDPVNGAFGVPTDDPDRNYYTLGLNAAAQFAGGRSAFIQYETLLGLRDVTNHIISAGVRLEF